MSSGVPEGASGGRRFAGRSAALGLVGFGLASVTAHNVQRVVKLRNHARSLRSDLDHDGTIGSGVGEPTELWVLGDSASDGYGLADPADAFPRHVAKALSTGTSRRVRLTSLGKDGARISDVTTIQAKMIQSSADAVVVLVGANDVFGRRSAKQVRADTVAMLDALQASSHGALLAVAGCPDFGKAKGFPQPLRSVLGWRCRATAGAMAEVCEKRGVPFIDLVPDTTTELFGEDGVHPSREGAIAAANGVVDALMQHAAVHA